jgi:hypothetical protein
MVGIGPGTACNLWQQRPPSVPTGTTCTVFVTWSVCVWCVWWPPRTVPSAWLRPRPRGCSVAHSMLSVPLPIIILHPHCCVLLWPNHTPAAVVASSRHGEHHAHGVAQCATNRDAGASRRLLRAVPRPARKRCRAAQGARRGGLMESWERALPLLPSQLWHCMLLGKKKMAQGTVHDRGWRRWRAWNGSCRPQTGSQTRCTPWLVTWTRWCVSRAPPVLCTEFTHRHYLRPRTFACTRAWAERS